MQWLKWGAVAVLAIAAVGCEDEDLVVQGTTTATIDPSSLSRIRVIGRVVNANGGPVSGATISVCGATDGVTSGADGRFIADMVGLFDSPSIGEGDGGVNLFVRVDASGLASQDFRLFSSISTFSETDGVNEVTLFDMDTITLRPAQSVNVVVTKDGDPLPGATVFAILDGGSFTIDQFDGPEGEFGENVEASTCGVILSARTGGSGVATIGGIDPTLEYTLLVPAQDLDGVAGVDFLTGRSGFEFEEGAVFAINVESTVEEGLLGVIAANVKPFPNAPEFFMITGPIAESPTAFQEDTLSPDPARDDEEVSFRRAILTADGGIRVVFQAPVTVINAPSGIEPAFTFFPNLRDPASASYSTSTQASVSATATEVAGLLGTVWDFRPNSPLQANEVFDLKFFAEAGGDRREVDNLSLVDQLNLLNEESFVGFYRPVLGNTSINVALDNYNGSASSASGTADIVFLDFDEVVTGSYKVTQFADGASVTVVVDPEPRSLGAGEIVFDTTAAPTSGVSPASLGATQGSRYRVPILTGPSAGTSVTLAYSDGTTARTVTFFISARDAEGVSRTEELTLPVR